MAESSAEPEKDYKTYIVVFKKEATDAKVNNVKDFLTSGGGRVKHEYSTLFKGFAVEVPSDE
ncbi:3556_t:CDS:2, partial [Ambispora leptoticha]